MISITTKNIELCQRIRKRRHPTRVGAAFSVQPVCTTAR